MAHCPRPQKLNKKQSSRLAAYFAAGVAASLATTLEADAAIVTINVGPSGFNINGFNGGLAPDTSSTISNFPFLGGGGLGIDNDGSVNVLGLFGYGGLQFAITGGYASPRNFSLNASIDNLANFSGVSYYTRFRDGGDESPDFGPGSYMGFRTSSGNYGWLEVTWDSASSQFQILSGAYESNVGEGIEAGAVPEPSTLALAGVAALVLGGSAYMRSRRRREAEQKEAA